MRSTSRDIARVLRFLATFWLYCGYCLAATFPGSEEPLTGRDVTVDTPLGEVYGKRREIDPRAGKLYSL